MEDSVRVGNDLEKAAEACQHLKVKYASSEELFAEAMGEMMGQPQGPGPQGPGGGMGGAPAPAAPAVGGGMGSDDVDPFAPQDDSGSLAPDDTDPLGSDLNVDPALEIEVEPVGDDEISIDLGGEMGNDVNVDQQDGGSVTIDLPVEAVKALDVALQTVMHGNLGNGTMNDIVPELPGAGGVDSAELPEGDELEEGDSVEFSEDNEEGEDDDEGEGDVPSFNDDEPKPDDSGDTKEPTVDNEVKEGDDADRFASYMRRGKQNRVGEINLDVSKILASINKKAGEVEPKQEGSQDVVDGYSAGDGSVQGNEEKFDADKPSVPRADATIGSESSDANPKDKPLPKVPKGGPEATLEGEKNYKAESGVNLSGGLAGAGKTETAKAKKSTKTAGEKKVDATPVSDVVEVEIDFSDNKDHSNTPDKLKRKPFEESDRKEIKNIPERGEGSFIGDEKTSIGDVPKSPKMNPSIPTEGGLLSKEKNEKNKPELTDKIKGFVAASGEKSTKAVDEEATRVAGRMLEAKLIDATQLMNKIAELRRYDVPQLKDIENAIFKAAQKGLATEPDGLGQTVPIISEASNERSGDLTSAIRSLFSLDQRNKIASELTDENLRKAHGL
jgi:hypothetical protein